jgi:hypothetical protein
MQLRNILHRKNITFSWVSWGNEEGFSWYFPFFVCFPFILCKLGGKHRELRRQLDTDKINYTNKIRKV